MLKILPAVVEVPHEVIVVHDTPGDDSVSTVAELGIEPNRLRAVLNTLGNGVANAIRAGVTESCGEYILIFAADEVRPELGVKEVLRAMAGGGCFASCR